MQGINSQIIEQGELNSLPSLKFGGKIKVLTTPDKADKAAKYLSKYKYLGFDTETRPSFTKGKSNKVSLLQISTDDKAFLFRVQETGLTESMIKLLSDSSINKIGVAVHDDIKTLQKIKPFKANGFVDLQKFAIKEKSVRKMTAVILKGRISKTQQLSNWENTELTQAQQVYAATDAWVCLKIYTTLAEMKIYTKGGDKGSTSLWGGERVSKNDARVEAYGSIDELSSALGIVRASKIEAKHKKVILSIQKKLMDCMSILASTENMKSKTPIIKEEDLLYLENEIDEIADKLPPMKEFLFPGDNMVSAHCHLARCICRRAERRTVNCEIVSEDVIKYLNRLSDYLFTLARALSTK